MPDNITEHRFYQRWKNIKDRCFRKNSKRFKDYGGRGITLAVEWVNDPKAFINYIENLPNAGEPGYTLDRIDNDGNYEPKNLRWTTISRQNLNQRKRKDNKSGVKGVHWDKSSGKWLTRYKRRHIGRFAELANAIEARKKAEENG